MLLATGHGCELPGQERSVFREVSLTLPGGGTLPIPGLGLDGTCGVSASMLGLAGGPRRDEVPPAPPPPGTLATLQAELVGVPQRVSAGSELRFEVVLSNPTDVDVSLSSCPGYPIFVGRAEVSHGLNCHTVTSIPAHGRVRYEMRVDVAPEERGITKFGFDMTRWGRPGTGTALEIEGVGEGRLGPPRPADTGT